MPVEAVCSDTGKRQLTREVAENAAKRARRNHDGERVTAYHCRCGWWHTGHANSAPKSKNRRQVS